LAILKPKREPAQELNENTDVDITSLSDNQVLQYDSASGLWKNETFSAGTLEGDSDTDITTPAEAEILIYDGVDSWDNKALSGDVTITKLGVVSIGALKVTNAMLAGSIAYSKLSLTGAILNADLAGSIAYSKLSLTGAILNADLAGSIAYSKLSLTGAILNADLAGSIAYSKLALTGAILDADLAGSIAYSKLSLTGAILNADLAGSIANTKLATNPLARANHTGTQASSTISDLATVVKAYRLDEFANPTSDIDLNDKSLIGIHGTQNNVETITSASSIAIDMSTDDVAEIDELGHAVTFTTSNRAVGRKKRIFITTDGTARALTFSESWRWVTAVPTTTNIDKNSILSLECVHGTATTDIVASWVEQP